MSARGGLPLFGLPWGIRAVVVIFGDRCGFGLLPLPEILPKAKAQSSGNSLNPRAGEGIGADPIMGNGIVDAPLVYDVAAPLYLDESVQRRRPSPTGRGICARSSSRCWCVTLATMPATLTGALAITLGAEEVMFVLRLANRISILKAG